MKKVIYFFTMLFAVTMISCSKEKDEPQVEEPEPEPIENVDGLSNTANPYTFLNKKIQIDVEYGYNPQWNYSEILTFVNYSKLDKRYSVGTEKYDLQMTLYSDGMRLRHQGSCQSLNNCNLDFIVILKEQTPNVFTGRFGGEYNNDDMITLTILE
ncbi:MAG: hypothetical protein LBN27_05415 [Prevotellaceae bacterium]|jgi:hypothetical protein|nr:hypothetical protein [Prevotellaceae bacterium]